MPGKFLTRDAIVDLVKSEERTNSIQRREGLTLHPVRATKCGCSTPGCGGWHSILTDRTIPTPEECDVILKMEKASRKSG
jgi:hypothetical protein